MSVRPLSHIVPPSMEWDMIVMTISARRPGQATVIICASAATLKNEESGRPVSWWRSLISRSSVAEPRAVASSIVSAS